MKQFIKVNIMQNKLNGIKEFDFSSIGYTMKYYVLNGKIFGLTEVTSHGIKNKSYYCRI